MSEFYFDSKIKISQNDLNLCQEPIIRIERNCLSKDLNYIMYMVFPDFYGTNEKASVTKEKIHFDTMELRYDAKGLDISKLEKEILDKDVEVNFKCSDFANKYVNKDVEEVSNEYLLDERYESQNSKIKIGGYRVEIPNNNGNKWFSGVGRVVLYNSSSPDIKTIIYFAVNFGFKKKILYYVNEKKILFKGNDIIDKIPIRVIFNNKNKRYPCLKSDNIDSQSSTYILEFNSKGEAAISIDNHKNQKKYVTFNLNPNEKDLISLDKNIDYSTLDNYYLLECAETPEVVKKEYEKPINSPFCPYCHGKLTAKYKNGGVSCKNETKLQIYTLKRDVSKSKLAKKIIYCSEDLDISKNSASKIFERVLPEDFINRNNYKIAVLGAGRAGKTTYISRLFDIVTQGSGFCLETKIVSNTTSKWCDISSYNIKKLYMNKNKYYASNDLWYPANNTYENYKLKIEDGSFIKPTNIFKMDETDKEHDPFKYPFIFNVNNRNYVCLYDVAGENVESNRDKVYELFDNNAPIGIFYIISGDKKDKNNGLNLALNTLNEVLEKYEENNKNATISIAVIVSKFDVCEEYFDKNCHCLRTDTIDMIRKNGKYEGSALERNIDMASLEIQSYLQSRDLDPFKTNNTINEKNNVHYNIKYFAISSFGAKDSVESYKQKEGSSVEINYLHYLNSPKRIELPVIWMLKQFGCIL